MSKVSLEQKDKTNPISLPQGWVFTQIQKVCETTSGGTPSRKKPEFYNGNIPWVKSGELNDSLILSSEETITELGLQNSNATIFPKRTILMAMYGATIGKLGILNLDASTNQAICAFFNDQRIISSKFLFYFLKYSRDNFIKSGFGGAQNNISQEVIREIKIPIAPLNEQKRIVLKIEKLFSIIDNYDSILKQILSKLHQYQNSFLISAFSGTITQKWRRNNPVSSVEVLIQRIISTRLEQASKASDKKTKKQLIQSAKISVIGKNPKINSWLDVKLENLVYIAGRIGWKGLKAKEYTENGPLFLSVYQLNDGGVVNFENSYHISKERYDESPEIQLQNNDILLVKDGSGIGKISIVQDIKEPVTVNSSLLVIRSGKAFIPKFLFYFLYGPELQNIAQQRITGSATPHLFQRDIKKFILSVPPLEEQIEIVKLIENGLTIIQNTHKIILNESKRVNSMKNLILQIAFEGKLLHQDPNDEPAEILLERIKQEKERLEQKQKIIKTEAPKRRRKNGK